MDKIFTTRECATLMLFMMNVFGDCKIPITDYTAYLAEKAMLNEINSEGFSIEKILKQIETQQKQVIK